jgi:aldose 1-epimerase
METLSFGRLSDGRQAGLYMLRNSRGMTVSLTDYGASIVSISVPDRTGALKDVVLGHDDVSGYENGHGSIGAIVGRVANRIGGGSFTLDGRTYELTVNNGPNTLHGGCDPYSKRLWNVRIPFGQVSSRDVMGASAPESISDGVSSLARYNVSNKTVTFSLDSPDGDQGFPGAVHIEVTYTLTDDNELHIDYAAESTSDTPLNLTNHSYFNMDGHNSGSVLDQVVQIHSGTFTASDDDLLPTGELRDVTGTPMDFRIPKALGRDIDADYDALKSGGGYDHNYVTPAVAQGYCETATLYSRATGIRMDVLTDMPGVQLYTANGMEGETGKDGAIYGPRSGVCFETQFWPDSVNHEDFPGGFIRAGERFTSRTTYRFSS